jgi:hypothetical protein
MVTDRSANIYEGAAGERIVGSDKAMTLDTVFAIFSTTKAIAGTAIMSKKASSILTRLRRTMRLISASYR